MAAELGQLSAAYESNGGRLLYRLVRVIWAVYRMGRTN